MTTTVTSDQKEIQKLLNDEIRKKLLSKFHTVSFDSGNDSSSEETKNENQEKVCTPPSKVAPVPPKPPPKPASFDAENVEKDSCEVDMRRVPPPIAPKPKILPKSVRRIPCVIVENELSQQIENRLSLSDSGVASDETLHSSPGTNSHTPLRGVQKEKSISEPDLTVDDHWPIDPETPPAVPPHSARPPSLTLPLPDQTESVDPVQAEAAQYPRKSKSMTNELKDQFKRKFPTLRGQKRISNDDVLGSLEGSIPIAEDALLRSEKQTKRRLSDGGSSKFKKDSRKMSLSSRRQISRKSQRDSAISECSSLDASRSSKCLSTADLWGSQSSTPTNSLYVDEKLVENATKYTKRAEEIVMTELNYVRKLILIGEGFPKLVQESDEFKNDSVCVDLAKQIHGAFQLVLGPHKSLIDEFRNVWKEWNEIKPNLAEAFQKVSPFLKQDTEFLRKKGGLQKKLTEAYNNKGTFSKAVDRFNSECFNRKIGLLLEMDQVHLRIGKYELLFQAYHKSLPDEFKEEKDAAFKAITKAKEIAIAMNDFLNDFENFKNLEKMVQRLNGVSFPVLDNNRKLIKEGPVSKISRKETQRRHLVLLSDYLLVCKTGAVGPSQLTVGHELSLKFELSAEGKAGKQHTRVAIEDNHIRHASFKVYGLKKSFIFQADSEKEMNSWVAAIDGVIKELYRKMMSRKMSILNPQSSIMPIQNGQVIPESSEIIVERGSDKDEDSVEDKEVGTVAPDWVPDKDVTTCMMKNCGASFTKVLRRHHCRGCGKLICSACCGSAPIKYSKYSFERVCPICFKAISARIDKAQENIATSRTPTDSDVKWQKAVLKNPLVAPKNEATADEKTPDHDQDNSSICGFVDWYNLKKEAFSSKKIWLKLYLDQGFPVLSAYKAPMDAKPFAEVIFFPDSTYSLCDSDKFMTIDIFRQNQKIREMDIQLESLCARIRVAKHEAEKWVSNLEFYKIRNKVGTINESDPVEEIMPAEPVL